MVKIFTAISFFLSFIFAYILLEPGLIKAVTDDVVVMLDITGEITISNPSDVDLGSIAGMTGGSATPGAITWNVTTSSLGGYTLTIIKDHLLRKGTGSNQTIADYTEATGGTPDYNWGAVGAGNEEFGFAPSAGADIVQKFKNNTTICNQAAGSVTDQKCWSPIPNIGSTAETVSYSSAPTDPAGADTAIKVKAEVGSSNHVEEGSFTCTITATASNN